jgi:chromosome segregation ATPase
MSDYLAERVLALAAELKAVRARLAEVEGELAAATADHKSTFVAARAMVDELKAKVAEVEGERDEARAEIKRAIAETVCEVVKLATDPDGPTPEWLQLVMDVSEGKYTPPKETSR